MKHWREYIGHLVFGSSAGIGAVIALKLVDSNPTLVLETFRSWGPLSLLGVMALFMVDRGFRAVVAASEKSAGAQQNMADSIRELANKDDREKEEQRRLLSYVGSQQEKILQAIERLEPTKERRASA
ncbi:MAG TPA: hypothetical protein VJW20_20300 [Candidatus Angelobacter sp.]|nr:hypothetical protein [Candidatus Angelobacter sp.]